MPLVDALGAMEVPRGGLAWLSRHSTAERIRALATGAVPLSHDGLDSLAMSNGHEHLRELLVTHGVLPVRDRYLAAYGRWAEARVRSVEDSNDRQLVAAYLRWHQGPRLAAMAESGTLTESGYAAAWAQTNSGVRLWAWLRQRDRDLVTCIQGDIDAFFAEGPSTRLHARSFLRWSFRTHRRAALELPADRPGAPRGIPEHERLDLLARMLGEETLDLIDRVASYLVLLDALPLTRVNRLRTSDFEAREDGFALHMGDDVVPVPSPLASLVKALAEQRRNISGAEHPRSDWLFPGRRAGQPIEPDQLAERLNRQGITRAARRPLSMRCSPRPARSGQAHRPPALAVAQRTKIQGTDWRKSRSRVHS